VQLQRFISLELYPVYTIQQTSSKRIQNTRAHCSTFAGSCKRGIRRRIGSSIRLVRLKPQGRTRTAGPKISREKICGFLNKNFYKRPRSRFQASGLGGTIICMAVRPVHSSAGAWKLIYCDLLSVGQDESDGSLFDGNKCHYATRCFVLSYYKVNSSGNSHKFT